MFRYFTGSDNVDFFLVAPEERSGNHQIRIFPLGNTNVCTNFHGNPSSNYSSLDRLANRPTNIAIPRAMLVAWLKTKTEKENQVSRSLKTHTRVTWKHLGFELVIYRRKHYHHCYTEWHNASIREYTVHIQEVCVCVCKHYFPSLLTKAFPFVRVGMLMLLDHKEEIALL